MAVVVLLLVGCAEQSKWDRIPLSGTATLDGQPFDGSLVLRPHEGNRGPSVTSDIAEGRFAFTRKTGPVAGAHQALVMLAADDPANPSAGTINLSTNVPSEKPFSIELDFATPDEPQPERAPPPAASENQPIQK